MNIDEAYDLFEEVLDLNGFKAVPAGDVIRIEKKE